MFVNFDHMKVHICLVKKSLTAFVTFERLVQLVISRNQCWKSWKSSSGLCGIFRVVPGVYLDVKSGGLLLFVEDVSGEDGGGRNGGVGACGGIGLETAVWFAAV